MHWEKSQSAERESAKPYQGVRVKDPVKELLRRKRGSDFNSTKTAPATAAMKRRNMNGQKNWAGHRAYANQFITLPKPTAVNHKPPQSTQVVLPNNALSSYPQIAPVGLSEANPGMPDSLAVDDGMTCTGWIAQPAAATLQPVGTWPCTDYLPSEQSSPAYASDMYVQPVCPSYTVVGPPSVLTYTHTYLSTNFATRPTPPTTLPQVDLPDSSLTYLPWAQPLPTFSASGVQCPPCTAPFPTMHAPPISIAELDAQRLDQARNTVASLPLEKLLEEDDEKDTYVAAPSLFIQDV